MFTGEQEQDEAYAQNCTLPFPLPKQTDSLVQNLITSVTIRNRSFQKQEPSTTKRRLLMKTATGQSKNEHVIS